MFETAELSRVERVAVALGRLANERGLPKWVQQRYLRMLTQNIIKQFIAPRVYLDGADALRAPVDRGVVLSANHRSLFDMWVVMLGLYESGVDWIERMFFPVRSNFFYDTPGGVFVNYAIGAGVMYPPIFRDHTKAELNKDALDRLAKFLARPGTAVGLHPEGTRGKGPDPYEMLPAQPGVGQIVLHAKPIVIPVFINGLPQDGPMRALTDSYRAGARRERPIILVYGEPVDYSALTVKKPRAVLYKKCADLMREASLELSERERELRAACARGDISDDDPNWLTNR